MMSQFDSPMIGNPTSILCAMSPLKGSPFAPAAVGFDSATLATGRPPVAIFFGNSSPRAEVAVRKCIRDLDAVAFLAAAFFLFLI
jgi:hypothetical protein